ARSSSRSSAGTRGSRRRCSSCPTWCRSHARSSPPRRWAAASPSSPARASKTSFCAGTTPFCSRNLTHYFLPERNVELLRRVRPARGHPRPVSDLLTGERVASTVAAAASALEEAGIAYGLMGGLAASVYGRPRATEDIDFLVKPTEAKRALDALGEAGFETEE